MGEVLAHMHDRSLSVFAPHTPPNPLASTSQTRVVSNPLEALLVAQVSLELVINPRIRESGHEGYKPTSYSDLNVGFGRPHRSRGRVMRAAAAPHSARLGGKTE